MEKRADPVFKASSPLPGRKRPAQDIDPGVSLNDLISVYADALSPLPQAYGYARRIGHMVLEDINTAVQGPSGRGDPSFKFFVTGSVGKRTAIAPIRTVDVILELPERLKLTKAKDALTLARTLAEASHPPESVKLTSTSINVHIPPMTVRVIPGQVRRQGVLIPGPVTLSHSSGWRTSNPVAESATFRLLDRTYAGRPRKLLHLVKAWSVNASTGLSGFALELLVMRYFSDRLVKADWLDTLQDFMVFARAKTPDAFPIPGNAGRLDIGSEWHSRAQSAYWRCMLAQSLVKERKVIDAALEMRGLFGRAFPVPGDPADTALPLFKPARTRAA